MQCSLVRLVWICAAPFNVVYNVMYSTILKSVVLYSVV